MAKINKKTDKSNFF